MQTIEIKYFETGDGVKIYNNDIFPAPLFKKSLDEKIILEKLIQNLDKITQENLDQFIKSITV